MIRKAEIRPAATARQRGERPKSEGDQNNIREANSLAWPKSEIRITADYCNQKPSFFNLRPSGFGFLSAFGFRPSDF